MGIRIGLNSGILPCSVENKIIKVHFFNDIIKEIETTLPNVLFDKQCNFFKTKYNKLNGVLFNDKYNLYLRTNGTIDLCTKNNILLYRGNYNYKELFSLYYDCTPSGNLSIGRLYYPMRLCKLSCDKYFLWSKEYPISILLSNTNPYSSYIIQEFNSEDRKYIDGFKYIKNPYLDNDISLDLGSSNIVKFEDIEVFNSKGFIGGILC